jgi:gas vesicle protein
MVYHTSRIRALRCRVRERKNGTDENFTGKEEMLSNRQHQIDGRVGPAIVTFFLGALFGSSLSLLFAPTSGRRLRRQIQRKGERLRLSAADSVSTLRDRGEDMAEKMGEVLEDTSQGIRHAARSMVSR